MKFKISIGSEFEKICISSKVYLNFKQSTPYLNSLNPQN